MYSITAVPSVFRLRLTSLYTDVLDIALCFSSCVSPCVCLTCVYDDVMYNGVWFILLYVL